MGWKICIARWGSIVRKTFVIRCRF